MKKNLLWTSLALAMALGTSMAQAATKPCDELKAEIAKKLDDKGVKGYELAIVDTDKVGDAKVVGSCHGGAHKVTYTKK